MKVIVTGAKGQLGSDVVKELLRRRHNPVGIDIDDFDITDADSCEKFLLAEKPDGVIHCAAWTAVDAAESEENKPRVYAINVNGTLNIAKICEKIDCKMMYISTDYVFDGQGQEPWKEDCADFNPLSVYGETKLEGEFVVKKLKKHFIVRTSWVFGENGNNFINTMMKLGQKHKTIRVVCDQIGTPTYTFDLAKLLVDIIETDQYGIYHATNEGGYISWYDFACEILQRAGVPATVIPVSTEEYGLSTAKRPYNSRLDKSKLKQRGFLPLPDWRDALCRYMQSINT